ncbi:MAG: IS91 family transposase, partial [Victivallales bacterium]|nr:IS91 family transposase [Victivallales bacterium]
MRDHLETFLAGHEQRHREHYGHLRPEVQRTLEELIECGDPHFGVARVRCLDCGDDTFVPLSCRLRGTCPSCHAKRQLVFGEYVLEEVLPDVACRQWTFSLPKALRVFFRYDGSLFKELSQIVVRELTRYIRQVTGHVDLEPGFVTVDQTFGTLPDDFHPHLHVAALDGGFTPDGAFVRLSRVRKKDVAAIEEVLRHAVLRRLVRRGKISEDFRD